MSGVMSTDPLAWQTLTEAAAALGVSTRTLQRRIVAGELLSRKDERGRVEVQVAMDALPPEVAATHALQVHADAHQQQAVALAQQVDVLARVVEQHHAELQRVRADSRASIRAWQVAASVAVVVSVVLGAVTVRSGFVGTTPGQTMDTAVVATPTVRHRAGQVVVADEPWLGVPFAAAD